MEANGKKKLVISKNDSQKIGFIVFCGVFIVLLIFLCISISQQSHIQGEYANARTEIGESVYNNLFVFCQTFDQVSIPGADVEGSILPTMKEYYLKALTLNEALVTSFGDRYYVLTQDNIAAINAALAAYDAAFRAGKPTDDAQRLMTDNMTLIRSILETRFNNGILKRA